MNHLTSIIITSLIFNMNAKMETESVKSHMKNQQLLFEHTIHDKFAKASNVNIDDLKKAIETEHNTDTKTISVTKILGFILRDVDMLNDNKHDILVMPSDDDDTHNTNHYYLIDELSIFDKKQNSYVITEDDIKTIQDHEHKSEYEISSLRQLAMKSMIKQGNNFDIKEFVNNTLLNDDIIEQHKDINNFHDIGLGVAIHSSEFSSCIIQFLFDLMKIYDFDTIEGSICKVIYHYISKDFHNNLPEGNKSLSDNSDIFDNLEYIMKHIGQSNSISNFITIAKGDITNSSKIEKHLDNENDESIEQISRYLNVYNLEQMIKSIKIKDLKLEDISGLNLLLKSFLTQIKKLPTDIQNQEDATKHIEENIFNNVIGNFSS